MGPRRLLGTLTAGILAYIGATTGTVHFLVMAAGLLAGVVVFFTVYWGPILYLVGVVYVTALIIVWLLNGTRALALGVDDAVVQVTLVATFLYLFAREHREQLRRPVVTPQLSFI